jgi:hypothetical protein
VTWSPYFAAVRPNRCPARGLRPWRGKVCPRNLSTGQKTVKAPTRAYVHRVNAPTLTCRTGRSLENPLQPRPRPPPGQCVLARSMNSGPMWRSRLERAHPSEAPDGELAPDESTQLTVVMESQDFGQQVLHRGGVGKSTLEGVFRDDAHRTSARSNVYQSAPENRWQQSPHRQGVQRERADRWTVRACFFSCRRGLPIIRASTS